MEIIYLRNVTEVRYIMSKQKIKYSNDISGKDVKRSRIMCKAAEVGKIVVNKCLDKGLFINTQKLQKLLVLMQVECIKRSGKALFKEDIRIWDCGVAIKEVDESFSEYGEGFTERQDEYITLLEVEDESVDYIIAEYGTKDAFELNSLPDNQKVIQLGVIPEGATVPHINSQILTGAFYYNDIT